MHWLKRCEKQPLFPCPVVFTTVRVDQSLRYREPPQSRPRVPPENSCADAQTNDCYYHYYYYYYHYYYYCCYYYYYYDLLLPSWRPISRVVVAAEIVRRTRADAE